MNSASTRPIVWSVAGSDSGGGAGIQADQRAFDALRVHGCTAVAALTAQNSTGVQRIQAVEPAMLEAQLAALASDLPPRAIKTGMLGSAANVQVLLRQLQRLPQRPALVVDPVWRASSDGADLSGGELRQFLIDELLPQATVCTPNRREAAWLLGLPSLDSLNDDGALLAALPRLRALSDCAWVVTGGDAGGTQARDLLLSPQFEGWLSLPHIPTAHHHGSGCTFAASLGAALAQGFCVADAAVLAKMATAGALHAGSAAGSGAGPVRAEPGFALRRELLPQAWPLQCLPHDPPQTPRFNPWRERGLYAVVDNAAWVERLSAAGVRTLQLRIKREPDAALEAEVVAAVAAARRVGATLFINDHWQLALRHGADGVHLGQEDLDGAVDLQALARAGLQLGVSSHSLWELARAWALKPSYIACGPVHATTTKAMPWQPQGAHNLAYWAALLDPLPVVAIGGLTPERTVQAARCRPAGFAVASGLTAAEHPEAAVAAYQQAWRAGLGVPGLAAPELPKPSL
ncbi:hydroxymethylpyrimidine kinase/phosphomethylpyrimidine kinase/thiamine-phosphate diphosphorylase [Inhella inkyongensis]|uniref:hydroxymethylpyrimidine kinase n=1 Tax=Inhella inkyongensis TaxID=392593 RepID=A0A840S0H2_9BURK|nr:bifunctional hydroxymethylpyrimidine kinase/phosphomethylpyrimidine kinase [Inhella inkyongensis]MBB5202878.1 hydroxymethylpyrimidine kinase/phosphomethylpyrimidine kinase/thiamine-phosphate diphosphorylase [Inhella inkyongensis]